MKARILAAFRSLFRKGRLEREMDEEMRFHVEMETQKQVQRGLSPEEARTRALRRFGGIEKNKEECREAGGTRWIETLFQDVRWALRALRKNPAYAVSAAVTLALGIGANVAVFSVVHAVFLQSLPYGGGERLVRLRMDAPSIGVEDAGFSALEVGDYAAQSQTLSGVVEYHSMSFILLDKDPERVRTGVVSASFFDVMGVRPMLGRTFAKGEDAPGAEPVLVLSYNYWLEHQGGDPRVVGRSFKMNDKMHTVIGVLPPMPQYPDENDLYMPISACPFRGSPEMATHRDHRMLTVFARMKPEATLAAVTRDLDTIFGRLTRTYADAYPAPGVGATVRAVSLKEELT
ncbi:MAG TPA: ABC transporter permease, partial [Thermoanaerobaculia bacterium]